MPSQAVFIATSTLAITSMLACIWMACRLRNRIKQTVLARPLLALVISEGVFEAWVVSFQLPPALGISGNIYHAWSPDFCAAIGYIGQFSEVAAALWFFIVAWMVIMVLLGRRTCHQLGDSWVWQNIFAWGITTTFTALPGAYQQYGPVLDTGSECWIEESGASGRMLFYGTIALNLCFCVFVLIVIMCRWELFATLPALLRKMSRWVFCFVAIWTTPFVRRIIQLDTGEAGPDWLASAHHFSVALCGCFTFLAWYSTEAGGNPRNPGSRGDYETYETYGTGCADESAAEARKGIFFWREPSGPKERLVDPDRFTNYSTYSDESRPVSDHRDSHGLDLMHFEPAGR